MQELFTNFNQLTAYPKNIEKLRQWIIDLGVQGQLTKDWRNEHPEVESASELLKRIQTEKHRLIKEKKIKKTKPLPPISLNDTSYDLPESWTWLRLGEVTDYGTSEKIDPKDIHPDTWVLDLEDIVKESNELLGRYTFLERSSQSTKSVFSTGDVLYSKLRPYLDKVIIANEPGVCTTEILPLTPFGRIDPYYLRLALKSKKFLTYVNGVTKGMKMPRLGTNEGRSAVIPIPPLPEQQAIVERIESLLTKVSSLQQRAEEVEARKITIGKTVCGWLADASLGGETARRFHSIAPQFEDIFSTEANLKALRQTILQLAVQGKLTEQWRSAHPEVEPASALLERIQAEKARLVKEKRLKKNRPIKNSKSRRDGLLLPEKWDWCKGEEIFFVTKLAGFEYTKYIQLNDTGEIPVIRAQNVRPLEIDKTNLKFIDSDISLQLERSALIKPSLLVTFIGAGIGDVALFQEENRWHLAPNVSKMEEFENCERMINLRYVNYFLLSDFGRGEIFKHMKATAKPSLSMGTIRDIDYPIPPLPEQMVIVEKVDSLLTKVNQLEHEVQQNQQYAEQLLQSVLREVMSPVQV